MSWTGNHRSPGGFNLADQAVHEVAQLLLGQLPRKGLECPREA